MRYFCRILFLFLITPVVLLFLPFRFIYRVTVRTIRNFKALKFARKNFNNFYSQYETNESTDERLDRALASMQSDKLWQHNKDSSKDQRRKESGQRKCYYQ